MLQPLLGGVLELGGDDGGLGEADRPGGATQPMGVAAQCFDCGRVVARSDQPFSQLCDRSELIAGSLQVLVPYSGREPEVVDLAHGVQDITSLSFDLMTDPAVGLCETCRWVRLGTNRRGAIVFRWPRADQGPPHSPFCPDPPLPGVPSPGRPPR